MVKNTYNSGLCLLEYKKATRNLFMLVVLLTWLYIRYLIAPRGKSSFVCELP